MKKQFLSLIGILLSVGVVYGGKTEVMTCRGRVVDEKSKPVAGARVWVFQVQSQLRLENVLLGETTCGFDGTFTLSGKARMDTECKRTFMIVAWQRGRSIAGMPLEDNVTFDITLTLGQPGSLAGCVVDEAGKPLAGAQVVLSYMGGDERKPSVAMGEITPVEPLLARTDRQGRFSFDQMPQNALAELTVRAPGRATVRTYPCPPYEGPFQFPAGKKDIRIVLPREARIEGTVTDKTTGKPASGMTVVAHLRQTRLMMAPFMTTKTDGGGRYHFESLDPARYVVAVGPEGDVQKNEDVPGVEVEVEAGKTSPSVPLITPSQKPQKVKCMGIVADDQGRPVAGVDIRFVREAPFGMIPPKPESGAVGNARTDEKGLFTFETASDKGDSSGLIYLLAHKKGYAMDFSYWSRAADLYVTFTLGRPSVLGGTVTDENGKFLSGAQIQLCLAQGSQGFPRIWEKPLPLEETTTSTNKLGQFVFHDVPATARAEFYVSSPGWDLFKTLTTHDDAHFPSFQFPAGKTDIKIVLPSGSRIRGSAAESPTGSGPHAFIQLFDDYEKRWEVDKEPWNTRYRLPSPSARLVAIGTLSGKSVEETYAAFHETILWERNTGLGNMHITAAALVSRSPVIMTYDKYKTVRRIRISSYESRAYLTLLSACSGKSTEEIDAVFKDIISDASTMPSDEYDKWRSNCLLGRATLAGAVIFGESSPSKVLDTFSFIKAQFKVDKENYGGDQMFSVLTATAVINHQAPQEILSRYRTLKRSLQIPGDYLSLILAISEFSGHSISETANMWKQFDGLSEASEKKAF